MTPASPEQSPTGDAADQLVTLRASYRRQLAVVGLGVAAAMLALAWWIGGLKVTPQAGFPFVVIAALWLWGASFADRATFSHSGIALRRAIGVSHVNWADVRKLKRAPDWLMNTEPWRSTATGKLRWSRHGGLRLVTSGRGVWLCDVPESPEEFDAICSLVRHCAPHAEITATPPPDGMPPTSNRRRLWGPKEGR